MGSLQLDLLRGKNHQKIMIAKITLVSMLAAVAVAAPEPQLGWGSLGYAGGAVTSHVPPACTPSTEEIEIQSCAPRAENVCKTEDVASEEITYEKRCKEVINKHCAGAVGGLIVKREANAEAEAEADPLILAHGGLPLAHAGIAPYAAAAAPLIAPAAAPLVAPAPVAYAVPHAVTKTIETPCTEVKTEHCVDVPIIKPVVTPVETCHVVTKVECTPAVHTIPKVTCEAGTTEVVHHGLPAVAPYVHG